jgi:hypothetical protein
MRLLPLSIHMSVPRLLVFSCIFFSIFSEKTTAAGTASSLLLSS